MGHPTACPLFVFADGVAPGSHKSSYTARLLTLALRYISKNQHNSTVNDCIWL